MTEAAKPTAGPKPVTKTAARKKAENPAPAPVEIKRIDSTGEGPNDLSGGDSISRFPAKAKPKKTTALHNDIVRKDF